MQGAVGEIDGMTGPGPSGIIGGTALGEQPQLGVQLEALLQPQLGVQSGTTVLQPQLGVQSGTVVLQVQLGVRSGIVVLQVQLEVQLGTGFMVLHPQFGELVFCVL